jgi:diguanylate cyclase (GGDEF)-like protein
MQLTDPNVFDDDVTGVLIVTDTLRHSYINESAASLLGVPLTRFTVGKDLIKILPELGPQIEVWTAAHGAWQEHELEGANGKIQVRVLCRPVTLTNGSGWLFFFQDLTLELRLANKYRTEFQQKLVVLEDLNRKVFELSFLQEVSQLLSSRETIGTISQRILDLVRSKFHIERVGLVQDLKSGTDVLASSGTIAGSERAQEYWIRMYRNPLTDATFELKISRTAGNMCTLLFQVGTPLKLEDFQLLKTASIQLFSRIQQEALYSSSITDVKTGLLNARFFQTALENELNRSLRTKEEFGLIIIDIDHFKKFNDKYGHQTGDDVLRHVAQKIQSSVRRSDITARFGGEEFCVLALKVNPETLVFLMEKIRLAIEQSPYDCAEHGPLVVTVSVGGAIFPHHSDSAEVLFELADKALYEAKHAGRNRSVIANISSQA